MDLTSSSSLLLTTILLAVVLAVIKRAFQHGSSKAQAQLPPGPWKLPVIGSLHHLLGPGAQIPHRCLRDLALKHGPLMHLKLGQVDHVVVSSRESAEEIMKTHDLNFASRPPLAAMKVFIYDFTDIAFSPYGPLWRQLRKICVMEILTAKRVKSFSSLRDEETANLVADISRATEPFNLSEKLVATSNAIVTRAAFGDKSRHHDRFAAAMRAGMELTSGFDLADLFPSFKPLIDVVSSFAERVERIHRQVDGIFDEVIQEHQAKTATTTEEDLVDVLLRLKQHGELEFPLTFDNIKAVILDMFVGGTASSSTTLDWTMSELMRNPNVMRKAQEEVRTVAKEKGRVDETDLNELSYLKSVLKETLRMHPPAPLLLPRECKDTCRVSGYVIPAGTRVMVNAWALGMDPRYWAEPERFNPERFENNPIDFKGADFEYLPFGAGRRMCPGITFGSAVMELVLARLLFHFDWALPDGMKPEDMDMTEAFGMDAVRKLKLRVIATPRF